jgi:hypothetical protein
MDPKTLFLIGCIPTRLLLAFLAARDAARPWLQWTLLATGLTFAYLFVSNSRLTAREAGGPTWWAPWRWVHATLYIAAGLLLVLERPVVAGQVLFVDVLIGLLLHVHRYYVS